MPTLRLPRPIRRLLGRQAPSAPRRREPATDHAVVAARRRVFEQLAAPPECPSGWRTGPPDFVIVGAQKSGTTWWFRLIEEHPAVVQPRQQRPELHFFDRLWDRWPGEADVAAYHRYFPRPEGRLVGEKTPEYLSCAWVAPMLAQAAPQARVILLLRDPVDRYVSGLSHMERGGLLSEAADDGRLFGDRRRVVTEAVERGMYATQLAWLREAFPAERILVLQYERCARDPAGQLARTYDFLGLAPHELSEETLARPRNRSQQPRLVVPDEHRELLARYYRAEAERLAAMVPDLDLDLWPSCRAMPVPGT